MRFGDKYNKEFSRRNACVYEFGRKDVSFLFCRIGEWFDIIVKLKSILIICLAVQSTVRLAVLGGLYPAVAQPVYSWGVALGTEFPECA